MGVDVIDTNELSLSRRQRSRKERVEEIDEDKRRTGPEEDEEVGREIEDQNFETSR